MIPGCVGRGVRLGSESLFGGGVWKSGNLEIQEFGDLGTWKSRNVGSKKSKKSKFSKSKSVLPKMSARSGLVGNKSSWPYLGPSEAFVSWTNTNQENTKFCIFSLVGQWALFTQCGRLLLSTRGGAIGKYAIQCCLRCLLWNSDC